MNLEQLIYIKEVVETKSISNAAENLHVSQSGISQAISQMEKKIGIKLFKRSRFGTVPTDEGKLIIKKALEILRKVDEMNEEIQALTSNYSGEIKIATVSGLFMTLLPRTLSKFKKEFPQININVSEGESMPIIDAVSNHEIDVGFIALGNPSALSLPDHIRFQSFPYENAMKVIVPQHSSLAFQKEVMFQEIADYPFVVYAHSYWENFIKKSSEIYGPINIIFTTTNTEVIKRTVAEGLGISMLTQMMLNDDPFVDTGRIVPLHLLESQFSTSGLYGWIYSKESHHYRLIRKFLKHTEL